MPDSRRMEKFVSEHDTPVAATQTTDRAERSGRPGRHISLRALVIFHVVATPIACGFASMGSPANIFANLVFFPLLYGQICLLGIWLAMGTNTRWCRVSRTLAGIAYLILNSFYTTGIGQVSLGIPFPILLVLCTIPTLGIAAVLLVVRVWKAHLVAHGNEHSAEVIEGLQFSIRHLFLLTTAVAVLLVMAQGVGLLLTDAVWLRTAVMIGMITLCFIAITLTTVWAGLGVGRPTERIVVVMLLAFFTGVLFTYVSAYERPNIMSWQQGWRQPTAMVLTAAVVTASLLVVRSNGYRLVRRTPRVTPNQNKPGLTIQQP